MEKTQNTSTQRDIGRIVSGNLSEDMNYFSGILAADKSFDLVTRQILMGGKSAGIYFIDGFCKDEVMQKLLQYFMDFKEEDVPGSAEAMLQEKLPYVEVEAQAQWEKIITSFLSGMFVLLVEGYDKAVLIDARTYPARSVSEPEKDKALRGSKDGFVETVVFNTAMIRRRIRDVNLRMEMLNAGESSHTDIAVCYMENRVDRGFLTEILQKIKNIQTDALTMNQESLAECLYQRKWYNPFPKFRYTERPDTAAAHVLEGDIVILVDNSPSAMILPTTAFDVLEESDDYYFPPVTGTYLRVTRLLISVLTYLLTPTFLLLMNNRHWVPEAFSFIVLQEEPNIGLLWQFLILELAIDGLKLAAVNTPNMLSTPLSVMAALVLGEFSVNSGWFSPEVMLYMAFVAIANYTQSNYEMGYALKFMRILTLILTEIFHLWGYLGGILLAFVFLLTNKTVSHKSYLAPLIPLDARKLLRVLFRNKLSGCEKQRRT